MVCKETKTAPTGLSNTDAVKNTVIPSIDGWLDFKNVSNKIFPVLVGVKYKGRLLRHVPHIPFLDMAIVFNIWPDGDERPGEADWIDNEQMLGWGLDTRKLYKIAMENAYTAHPAMLLSMGDAIVAMLGHMVEKPEGKMIPDTGDEPLPNFVLSNKLYQMGAVCFAYDGLLKRYAKELGSFYILPSSIHEVILVPSAENVLMAKLTDKVRIVNKGVSRDDYLSDHAYFYDAEKGAVIY